MFQAKHSRQIFDGPLIFRDNNEDKQLVPYQLNLVVFIFSIICQFPYASKPTAIGLALFLLCCPCLWQAAQAAKSFLSFGSQGAVKNVHQWDEQKDNLLGLSKTSLYIHLFLHFPALAVASYPLDLQRVFSEEFTELKVRERV